ncbi:putative inorganic polyphosphate/ATP-NAD kinase [Planctomycetes bacterium Pan216]|uniref:Putative inorganic polyphosphate/ATP-NAD kinase n=1 Tax=Kolteria novifilia TaxID=2527975 RepID=A0A518B554_9BACT|nr:putative inorganic polyphosphate/ATP-NAD kinase [Planctomycetes bacterium Pan216]
MANSIAIYGGSFNPPGTRHRAIAEMLSNNFDEVIVVPWAPTHDRRIRYDVAPVYRATMADMTFRGMERVRVELFDLDSDDTLPSSDLSKELGLIGDVWHVVTAQMCQGGKKGESAVHKEWQRGDAMWKQLQFAVVKNVDEEVDPDDLPPKCKIYATDRDGGNDAIRERIFHHQPVDDWIIPEVLMYIRRHALYSGAPQTRTTRFTLDELRPMIYADPYNPKSQEIAKQFPHEDRDHPNLIVVIGGDGTMLRAIREHWRLRVPFYGINTGHLGFLLNSDMPTELLGQALVLEQLSLLHVDTVSPGGETKTSLGFNEAWVERATGQTAWIEVRVNGRQRLCKLVSDGALVATPGGSTSYARAMGATPLPLSTPALLLVGNNVLFPTDWKPVLLPLDTKLEFRTLDPHKRPLMGYVDGVSHDEVHSMSIRVSSVAAVELAFDPHHDPAEKLARIQFPMPEGGA